MIAFLNLLDGSSIQQPFPKPLPADGQVKLCGKICLPGSESWNADGSASYQPGFSKGTELIIPLYLYMYSYKIWDLLDWFQESNNGWVTMDLTMAGSQWKD